MLYFLKFYFLFNKNFHHIYFYNIEVIKIEVAKIPYLMKIVSENKQQYFNSKKKNVNKF